MHADMESTITTKEQYRSLSQFSASTSKRNSPSQSATYWHYLETLKYSAVSRLWPESSIPLLVCSITPSKVQMKTCLNFASFTKQEGYSRTTNSCVYTCKTMLRGGLTQWKLRQLLPSLSFLRILACGIGTFS